MFGLRKGRVTETALNYSTQIELIFPAALYSDLIIAPLLERVGIVMEASGNKIMLFTDERTVAALNADEKIKKSFQASKIGTILYGWNQQDRTSFIINELREIADKYAGNDEALRLAVIDFHRWISIGMLGQIDPNPFAAPLPSMHLSEKFDVAAALKTMQSGEEMNKPKAPDHLEAAVKFGAR